MVDKDTLPIPDGVHVLGCQSRGRAVPANVLSLAYAAYFPLVLIGALGGPVILSQRFGLPIFEALQYSLAAAAVAYLVGIGLLLR